MTTMSRWVFGIGFLCMLYAAFVYYPKWKLSRTEATISWDVSGYYLYLPAIFIYHDLKDLQFKQAIDEKYYPASSAYQSFTHTSGHQVMKYTAGLAILYSPFFLIAHVLAKPLGYTPDGYSQIYQFFISLGGLCWAFIGLFFLRKVLLKYFSDRVVAMLFAVLLFATNYFDYASITGAMSHNYLFSLYALLIYFADKFYSSKQNYWFYYSCLVIGLMVLIRPTEIIAVVLLVAWHTKSLWQLKERIIFFLSEILLLIKGVFFFMLFPCFQIIYWKYVSGEWIVYSYQEQGFSWLEGHHILQGLFSYRAGWLIYTPVMILLFGAISYNIIKKKEYTWYSILFVLLSLYITFAWDEWTYGGSLSARALVQHYPIMLFCMAPFFKSISENKWILIPFIVFLTCCTYYNLWLTHHAHKGGIYEAGMMNKSYFWHTLFKSNNDLESKKLLDTNEPFIEFSESHAKMICDIQYISDSTCASSGNSVLLFDSLISNSTIKIKLLVKATLKEWDIWQMAQLVVQYKAKDKVVKTVILRLHRFLNDNDEKWIDLTTASPSDQFDTFSVFIWNPSQQIVCAKELQIYAAE